MVQCRICPFCKDKRYSSLQAFDRHKSTCFKNPDAPAFECPQCARKFTRKDNMQRHEQLHSQWIGERDPHQVDPKLVEAYDAGEIPIETLFDIKTTKEMCANSAQLKAKECVFQVDMTQKAFKLAHGGRLYNMMQNLFQHISEMTKLHNDNVLVQVTIESKSIAYPITTGVHIGSELKFTQLFDRLDKTAQSHRLFEYDEEDPELKITVFQMPLPTYAGGTIKNVHRALIDPQHTVSALAQKGIITNCLVASICLSLTNTKKRFEKRINKHFIDLISLFPNKSTVTRLDFQSIGAIVFSTFSKQIIIITPDCKLLYDHCEKSNQKLFLVAIDNHIVGCRNITRFVGTKNVCHCGHLKRGKYFCHDRHCRSNQRCCARCNTNCQYDINCIYCSDCSLTFKGHDCFNNHLLSNCKKGIGCSCTKWSMSGITLLSCIHCSLSFKTESCFKNHFKNTCDTKAKCTECGRIVNRESMNDHHCRETYCKVCTDYFPWDHVCYIKKTIIKPAESVQKFIIFDFETVTDSFSKKIIPILSVGVRVCAKCIDNFTTSTCCSDREFTFSGPECLSLTLDYILKQSDCLVLSFCGSKFDNVLLFENLVNRNINCNILLRGQSLLVLKSSSITCKDIYLFLPSALHVCATQFGLSQQKSFYPLKKLNFETLNQRLRLTKEDFDYSKMSPRRQNEFNQFYKQYLGRGCPSFNMKEHLIRYCRTDVMVTWELVSRFRNIFMSTFKTPIDPFVHSNGLPSLCALLYKTEYMPENSIQLIGDINCLDTRQESEVATKYMWALSQFIPQLQTQERLVGRITADGYDPTSKTAYFFDGCYWHCCECQRKHGNARHPTRQLTYREIQEADLDRNRTVINAGFNVEIIKECQINAELRKNTELRAWFDQYDKMNPLKPDYLRPREGVFGGRTGACSLLVEVNDDYKLMYKDVVSLYPFVQSTFPLPIGKFKRIRCEQINPDVYHSKVVDFGFYYCVVDPDPHQFWPVLPVRVGERLVFTNCLACATVADHSKISCTHLPQQRYLTGVYTSAELNEFLKCNGRIIHIYEYWAFDSSTELYADYIRALAKSKIESSGWPESCVSESDRIEYAARLKSKCGIVIEPVNVTLNKSLRAMSKTLMNATWGKHCENPSSNTKIVKNSNLVADAFKKGGLERARILPGNSVMIQTKTDKPTSFNNLVLGAFVTSWARLELLRYLQQAGPLTAYHDTDSIIYVQRIGDPDPVPSPETPVLGELKDEHPNRRLTKYCSIGSKAYAIKDKSGWEDVKFKGIQGGIDYKLMRQMLTGSSEEQYSDGHAVHQIRKILGEEAHQRAHTKVSDCGLQRCIFKPVDDGFIKQRESEKQVKLNFTNRRIVSPASLGLPDVVKLTSVPWGYVL